MSEIHRSQALVWLISLSGLLLLWAITAYIAQSRALPSPWQVAQALSVEFKSGDLLFHLGATLSRVIAAFFLAMLIGSVIGIALGQNESLNHFFDPWVILFLNIPALVIIVLSFIWFGLNEAAAIGAVALNKIPNVVVTMREGARALEPGYTEMARVFRFSRWKSLVHVVLPQLQPYFAAATRSGISLIWKIVLVVELLGRSNGVGFQIHSFFSLFDVASILAYTLSFVTVMLFVEFVILQRIEARARRWRVEHD